MAKDKRRPGTARGKHGTQAPEDRDRTATRCRSCGAELGPDAKFCHRCGAPLGAAARRGNAVTLALFAGLAGLVFAAVVGLAYLFGPDRFDPPRSALQDRTPSAAPPTAPSVDLSQMSPREAADRLFNRVMAAEERGDLEEARRFAPMAVQAYGRVSGLDADTHYHLGLLHGVIGDADGVRRQIAALREYSTDHLLAFALEYELAEQRGDRAAAARAADSLAAAYQSEIASGRPEYGAHEFSIERVREAAAGPAGEAAESAVAQGPARGAALFAEKCALCHGSGATGTEQGPPLVHPIYEPGHHADGAFLLAVRRGVRAHHWDFGDMPPVDGLSDAEVRDIVAYVRGLQAAAGIE